MSDHMCEDCGATGSPDRPACICGKKFKVQRRKNPVGPMAFPMPAGGGTAQYYTLERSGRLPLKFAGAMLACVSGHAGRPGTRWHVLSLYKTVAGQHVLAIAYRSQWKNEPDHFEAHLVDGPADAEAVLLAYNPVAHVLGWPIGERFANKQERLLAEVRASYEALVSELMAKVPTFCERIA